MFGEVLFIFGALFPIVNPISTAFVFNALTSRYSPQERNELALLACVFATGVLLAFMLLGQVILVFFGITLYAFRVAGGLYLLHIAYGMLAGSSLRKEPEDYTSHSREIAFIPLAIPLLSGPGSMAAVLVLSHGADALLFAQITLAILLVFVVAYVFLRYSYLIERFLGRLGVKALERILGLIVLVIAVQFLFNGIFDFIAIL